MKRFKYLLLLPVIAMASCGYSVDYLVPGDRYVSIDFQENYYHHWDKELKKAKKEEIEDVTEYIIRYSDLEQIDPNIALPGAPKTADQYGEQYKMNSVDESFNYGYQSKLFDGHMHCGGSDPNKADWAYQKGRVQIASSGFSIRFSKESNQLQYFALQFKATTDNTVECYKVHSDELAETDTDKYHNSVIDLNVTLYEKTNKGIIGHPFVSRINIDSGHTNNGGYYMFYAFDLKEYNISRLVGVSITYEYDDDLINWNKQKGIDNIGYALFLYEMFFPYTSWN